MRSRIASLSALALVVGAGAPAAPRDVQFRSVDFDARVIELRNYGAAAQSLSGFRFCTSSPSQVRVYTTTAGLNGVTLNPGESFFLHLSNDAPMGDPLRRNASSVGNFAPAFGQTAYGLSIYFPPISFGSPVSMGDHLMWNIDGVTNAQAATRAGVAVAAGLWTSTKAFIATSATTSTITLLDASGGMLLHAPVDYAVAGAQECPGDTNGDSAVNFADLNTVLAGFGQSGEDLSGDLNGDGTINFTDLNEVLAQFGSSCG